MTNKEYITFHDNFTKENNFEFSHGIYLIRDLLRGRETNKDNITIYLNLLKKTNDIDDVLNYLASKNNSELNIKTLNYIKNNPIFICIYQN